MEEKEWHQLVDNYFTASCYNKAKGNAAIAGGGANLRRNVMTQTVGITAEEAPLNTREGTELVHSGQLSLSRGTRTVCPQRGRRVNMWIQMPVNWLM